MHFHKWLYPDDQVFNENALFNWLPLPIYVWPLHSSQYLLLYLLFLHHVFRTWCLYHTHLYAHFSHRTAQFFPSSKVANHLLIQVFLVCSPGFSIDIFPITTTLTTTFSFRSLLDRSVSHFLPLTSYISLSKKSWGFIAVLSCWSRSISDWWGLEHIPVL